MDISNFELMFLNGVYVSIVLLTLGTCPKSLFLSILHHSNTPILLEGSLPAKTNSAIAALNKIVLILACQAPTVFALAQALPSCQQERDGRIGTTGKLMNAE